MAQKTETIIGRLFRSVYQHQAMVVTLAMRELQSRYAGTIAGALWALAHPIAVIVIFYVVFAIGFRSQGASGTPFVLWFVAGFVPWLFFNETLLAITESVTRNAHFIKKTVFPSEILAVVHTASGLIPHAIFILLVTGMLLYYHVVLHMKQMLIVYFMVCACVLVIGLGWLLSALQVFYRDISHGLAIVLNLWFWVTPIVWRPSNMPEEYRGLLVFNPLYYIIEGYRTVLISERMIWPEMWQTLYFWTVAILCLFVGAYVFGRLKPDFADVM